ncbi:hypothetical protein J7E38_10655 [Bacillus sp. ISL-35]|nr:hypothetical protein [Bacillus sp. ISL-35]MBT2679463.1 hypothetical protein [Bacillus sp. ISL-35]MBT2703366.1 hypothetical protein [Chryseobacterium sp. ISL-80]
MEMNYLALEYIWNSKQEELKRKASFRETYQLYSKSNQFDCIRAIRRENK